jgi:hypothetical protein
MILADICKEWSFSKCFKNRIRPLAQIRSSSMHMRVLDNGGLECENFRSSRMIVGW